MCASVDVIKYDNSFSARTPVYRNSFYFAANHNSLEYTVSSKKEHQQYIWSHKCQYDKQYCDVLYHESFPDHKISRQGDFIWDESKVVWRSMLNKAESA